MKLLPFLVFIFLEFNLSKESDLDELIDSIYDYLPYIIKGISSSNSTLCSNVFANNKKMLLPLLKDVLADLEDGQSIVMIGINYWLRAVIIDGFIDNCNLFKLGNLLNGIDSIKGIKTIGKAIEDNNRILYDLERDIKKAKDLEDILYYFGKIIYNIINFEFK